MPIHSQPIINVAPLPVMEHFYSIQGEGAYTGHAAYFIRLAGCDVGCVWCDVKESWDAAKHPLHSSEELAAQAAQSRCGIAVVTGGEPAMHNLNFLAETLRSKGLRTHIETSGAHVLSGTWDWVCVSPKKFKSPLPAVLARANELKVVVYHKSDFRWAEDHAAKVSPHCQLYLQPEWSRREQVMPLITSYVKRFPRWKISLQTHKYLDIP